MPGKRGNLVHLRVLPDGDLVLGVAMSRNYLIYCFGEHQVADLAAGVHCIQQTTLQAVPETNCFVGCPTS